MNHTTDTRTQPPTVGRSRLGAAAVALAVLMPLGPAAVALLRYVLPYYQADGNSEAVAAVEAEPGTQSLVLWLGVIAVYTLVPGVIAAGRLCRSAAPRLTAVALALVVPGYLSFGGLLYADQVLWSGVTENVSPSAVTSLLDGAHPTIDIQIVIFVLGHVIGTVLLGLALLRSGRIPGWAAWVLVVSQPLHFVATVILGNPTVDLVAWSMTALAMGFAGYAVLQDSRRVTVESTT